MVSRHQEGPSSASPGVSTVPADAHAPGSTDEFDIPIMLALAFWTALFGVFIERSQILLSMLKTGSPFSNPFNYFLYSTGSFLLNFAALLTIALIAYYLILSLKRSGALRRILTVTAVLVAGAAVLTALTGLIFQTTVIIFLSSQLLALVASIVLLACLPGKSIGFVKMILMILPVLSFLFLQLNQVHFFFPHLIPSPWNTNIAGIFLLTGQIVFLVFAALAAVTTARWNRKNKLPLFIPLLIAISILFISVVSTIASEKARIMFLRIIEAQHIMSFSYYIYPVAFSLIFFTFALLLTGRTKDHSTQILRFRSGYAIGFITLGTFTPATCYETVFLLIGMVLWLQTIAQGRDIRP